MGVVGELGPKSSLTVRQLAALSEYIRVASGEIGLLEASQVLSTGRKKGIIGHPVSAGSYYRIVSQAKKNVRRSLMTTIIALRLGLLNFDDVRKMFELVGRAQDVSDQEADHFFGLLTALVDRMVP